MANKFNPWGLITPPGDFHFIVTPFRDNNKFKTIIVKNGVSQAYKVEKVPFHFPDFYPCFVKTAANGSLEFVRDCTIEDGKVRIFRTEPTLDENHIKMVSPLLQPLSVELFLNNNKAHNIKISLGTEDITSRLRDICFKASGLLVKSPTQLLDILSNMGREKVNGQVINKKYPSDYFQIVDGPSKLFNTMVRGNITHLLNMYYKHEEVHQPHNHYR